MVLALYSFSILFSSLGLLFSKVRHDGRILLRSFPAGLC